MKVQFVNSSGVVIYEEGDDYSAVDRTDIDHIRIVDDSDVEVATYSPEGTQEAKNALFRRRVFKSNASEKVLQFFGFPFTDTDDVYVIEDGVITSVTPSSSSPLYRPVVARSGEFQEPTPPPVTDELVGAHFTQSMLTLWEDRWATDWMPAYSPYNSLKSKITSNKDYFLANTTSLRFAPALFDADEKLSSHEGNDPTSLLGGTTSDTRKKQYSIRDAAYFYLVTGKSNSTIRNAVVTELLWMANNANFDFGNGTKYNYGGTLSVDSVPLFGLNNMMSSHLHAYEYTGADAFTSGEQNTLNDWFYYAADYAADGLRNGSLNNLFVNRLAGNYNQQGSSWTGSPGLDRVTYYSSAGNGPTSYSVHRFFNNRKATAALFCIDAALSLKLKNYTLPGDSPHLNFTLDQIITEGVRYFKECIMFAYFPTERTFGEFNRNDTGADTELGFHYLQMTFSMYIAAAFMMALNGDRTLLDFTTRQGALGTECTSGEADKEIVQIWEAIADHYAQFNSNPFGSKRYAINTLTADNLIEGRYPSGGGTHNFTKFHWVSMLTPWISSPTKLINLYKLNSSAYADDQTSPGSGFRMTAEMGPADSFVYFIHQFLELESIV